MNFLKRIMPKKSPGEGAPGGSDGPRAKSGPGAGAQPAEVLVLDARLLPFDPVPSLLATLREVRPASPPNTGPLDTLPPASAPDPASQRISSTSSVCIVDDPTQDMILQAAHDPADADTSALAVDPALFATLLSVQPAFGTAILRFLGFELPTARAGQSQVAELDRAAVPQLLDRLALLCSDVLAPIPAPAGSASTAGHTSGDNIPPKESASSSKSKSKGRSVAPLPSTLSLGTGRRVSERLGAWYRLIARLDPGMAAPGHDLPAGLHMGPATRPESITFAQLALVLQSLAHLACQIYRQMALSLFHPDVMLSVREILRQHVAGRLALDTVDSLPGLPVPVAATLRRCHPPQQLGFARVLIRGAAQFVCRSRNPADQVPRSLEAVDALLADPARSYLTQDEFIAWVQDQVPRLFTLLECSLASNLLGVPIPSTPPAVSKRNAPRARPTRPATAPATTLTDSDAESVPSATPASDTHDTDDHDDSVLVDDPTTMDADIEPWYLVHGIPIFSSFSDNSTLAPLVAYLLRLTPIFTPDHEAIRRNTQPPGSSGLPGGPAAPASDAQATTDLSRAVLALSHLSSEPVDMLFDAARDGFSLQTFSNRVTDYPAPTLVIFQTTGTGPAYPARQMALFVADRWRSPSIPSQPACFGTSHSFVVDISPIFHLSHPRRERFHAYNFFNAQATTSAPGSLGPYLPRGGPDAPPPAVLPPGTLPSAANCVGIGAGGTSREPFLHIDGSLMAGAFGSPAPCQTYRLPAFPRRAFEVSRLQVWGFGGTYAMSRRDGQRLWEKVQSAKSRYRAENARSEWEVDREIIRWGSI